MITELERESIMAKKEYKTTIVGKVNAEFCKMQGIEEYSDFLIAQSTGLIYHASKHSKEFSNEEGLQKSLNSITEILLEPYFMYYDETKKSIKYYKKIDQFVCVVVNILTHNAFVATIYPVSQKSIEKLKGKIKTKKLAKS